MQITNFENDQPNGGSYLNWSEIQLNEDNASIIKNEIAKKFYTE